MTTTGQMRWMAAIGTGGEKILHLRQDSSQAWKPYLAFSHLAVPDYRVPGISKGWATYQKLRQCGWELLPSPADNSEISGTSEATGKAIASLS